MTRQVVVYTQPLCADCQRLEEFLAERDVSYVRKDPLLSEEVADEMYELGILTTPTIVIEGEMVEGFDQDRIEELLRG